MLSILLIEPWYCGFQTELADNKSDLTIVLCSIMNASGAKCIISVPKCVFVLTACSGACGN